MKRSVWLGREASPGKVGKINSRGFEMTKVVIKEGSIKVYKDGHYIMSIFHDEESEVLDTPNYSFISLGGFSRVYPDEIVDEREAVK